MVIFQHEINQEFDIAFKSMKTHVRTKSKQLTPANNNFSEKYIQLTKEKKFLTPSKKVIHIKSQQKDQSPTKNILNMLNRAVTPKSKQSKKIKINMQIKNVNIFSSESMGNLQKNKKLHKKTISCLQQPKQYKKKLIELVEPRNMKPVALKHKKTKSQQNIKLSAGQWSQLLSKNNKQTKNHQNEENIISKFAYCNRTGFAYEKKDKINQDTFIILQNFMMKNRHLFGVCDGHGVNGQFVSQFIREILPENIQYFFIKNSLLHKHNRALVESSIRDAFIKTEKDLSRQMDAANIDIKFSGTTACLTYVHQNKIYCANLGDSRAVMFSRNAEQWSVKSLSQDHKGQNPVQAQRIIINGGRIEPYYDEDGQPLGPFRVWMLKQNIPGLAMTRSFGDAVASRIGVISQPEILQFQIKKENKFMVIASDGLWQFISNQEVMDLVVPAFVRNDVHQAVQILQKKAVQAWIRQDQNIDDITIIVIFFKYY